MSGWPAMLALGISLLLIGTSAVFACALCPKSLALRQDQIQCLNHTIEARVATAQATDPQLINLDICRSDSTSDDTFKGGTFPTVRWPDLPTNEPKSGGSEQSGDGHDLEQFKKFAYLSKRQVQCISKILPELVILKGAMVDLNNCQFKELGY